MPRNYVWMPTEIPPKCKLSKWQKRNLQHEADQFVAEFYKPAIKPPPQAMSVNATIKQAVVREAIEPIWKHSDSQ